MRLEAPNEIIQHMTLQALVMDTIIADCASFGLESDLYVMSVVRAHKAALEAYREALENGRVYDFLASRH